MAGLVILHGMPHTVIRSLQLGSAAIFLALGVSMVLTTPNELGPFGLTIWFVVFLIGLVSVLTLGFYRFGKGRGSRAGFMRALRRGFLAGIWITGILALSSLRQLSLRDIILLTVLVLAVDFYMQRMRV